MPQDAVLRRGAENFVSVIAIEASRAGEAELDTSSWRIRLHEVSNRAMTSGSSNTQDAVEFHAWP
jgi:hypothetical protein